MTLSLVFSLVALLVSLVSAIAGWMRWRVTHHQIRVQNLLQISSFLHQEEYREARQKVRTTLPDNLDMDAVRKVCSSFDFAGLFVKNKLIPEDLFLQYWGALFIFLKEHMGALWDEFAFGNVSVKEYYAHFFWLTEQAEKRVAKR